MSSREFNPQRLSIARQKRGLTKLKLAEAVKVTTRSITAYETGEFPPSEETIAGLAATLKFPRDFFYANDLVYPQGDGASFRSMTSATAAQRNSALASGALAIDLAEWIDQRFSLPKCNLLDLRDYSPEDAAFEVRILWKLGERPISNTVHLLEAHGVRVFSLAENCRQIDAFSFWRENAPFIFLNTMKSAERSRFDAMHELGHLVLHRHGGPGGRTAEQEADAFAAAMLLPRADVLAHAPRYPSLHQLIEKKKRWTVAVSALNHRLHSLGLTSEWHYRTLCIQISESGYRVNEPEPAQRETSQLFQKVFATLKEDGISRVDVARQLQIPTEDLDALIFGLVLVGLGGGNLPGRKAPSAPMLRVVPSKSKES